MVALYQIIMVVQMLAVNLSVSFICSKKKYSMAVTWLVFLLFSIALIVPIYVFSKNISGFGNGNGLFILAGFLYLIPIKILYDQSFKYTITVMCTTWIYTCFVFVVSYRIASLFNNIWLVAVIVQSLLYMITAPLFFKTVNQKLTFLLKSLDEKTANSFLILSMSWFLCIIFINFNFSLSEGSPIIQLLIVVALMICSYLSYNLIYSLITTKKVAEKLQKENFTDSLTRLRNKESLYKKANELINENVPFSIVFIDLDDFKTVNDEQGHFIGDKYLVDFAQTVKRKFLDQGTFYRLSGDEFIFLFKGEDIKEFCKELEKTNYDNKEYRFKGLSLGYSSFPEDAKNLNDLIRIADRNMYINKKLKKDNKKSG